jgi:hypothetical protein
MTEAARSSRGPRGRMTKWEYMFIEAEHDDDRVLAEVNAAGAQAWG